MLPARRHHPGARARPCACSGGQACAAEAARPPHGDEHVRPRRQGYFRRCRATGKSDRMTFRIAEAFARLARESRAGLIPFVMAGDPDPETSLAIVKALPQ